jgi:hypothetical protein
MPTQPLPPDGDPPDNPRATQPAPSPRSGETDDSDMTRTEDQAPESSPNLS